MNNPCFNCTARAIGCHGKCEKHRAWLDTEKERKAKEKRARDESAEMAQYVRASIFRKRRRG